MKTVRYYFDHNATTPASPEAAAAMTECLLTDYGNASSIHHFGQQARQRLELARRRVATLLGCGAKDVVFTSGGTESDNLAIFGSAPPDRHVITTAIEHPAVLNACSRYERVTIVPVSGDGVVDPADIRKAIRPDTALISVMHANNETGAIQPVAEIASIAREAGVTMHSDGVQAAAKIPVNVTGLGIDLYSISGHKLYGPKGTGALYVRPGVKLKPMLYGGRHERERRAGTENVPGAVALGVAAELASPAPPGMRDRLEQGILSRVPDARVNSCLAARIPNTSSICFEGIEGESMVISLDLQGFAVSSGSACSSGSVEPSHVLLAMGLSREDARSSLRFSLGGANTAGQVDLLIEAVAQSAAHLRRLSPAYA